MKYEVKVFIILGCISLLAGCSAALVPYSSDPQTKLGQATVLFENLNRPLPAERLIREAIEIYQAKNDTLGLAEGYRKYGIFYRSYAVEKWEQYYREKGFSDKDTRFDQRFDKAIEYFSKSREIFVKAGAYDDKVSNIDLNMAWTYEEKGEQKLACKALDSSLAYNAKFRAAEPDAKIDVGGGVQSFEEVISQQKKRIKCI